MLDLGGEGEDLLLQPGFVAIHQDGGFPVGKSLALSGFFQDGEHSFVVGAFSGGLLEGSKHFFVVDEFLGVNGFGVIHGHIVV